MNIDRVWLERYGPVRGTYSFADGLQLVRGPNESGKSLLVEAILNVLVGPSGVRTPRIEERPEGYLLLETDGAEHKLTPEHTLVDFYDEEFGYEITPEELRNVFVIRDADLRIEREDEFYERVTDRITGIRTRDIRRVKEALRERGRLTETRLDVSAHDRFDSAGDQLESARQLLEEIDDYRETAEETDRDALESRLLEARARRRELESDLAELERAKAWDRYDRLRNAVERTETAIEERRSLPEQSVVADLKKRVADVEDAGRAELVDRKDRYTSLGKYSIGAGILAFALVLFLGGAKIAIAGPVLGFASAVYFAWKMRQASERIADIDASRESLRRRANAIGVSAESPAEVRAELERIERERADLTETIDQERGVLGSELDVHDSTPDGVVSEARTALERIESDLDSRPDREFSQSALESTKEELESVREEISDLEDRLADHRQRLRAFASTVSTLDFRTFTGSPLDVEIRSLESLETVAGRIEEFVAAIERDASLSREAHRVFDSMERDEEQKVADLFGEGSDASRTFSRITAGRYKSVRYDHESNDLVVETSAGREFVPADLSKATRDQLYLSVRVALARTLPNVDTGFFVFDDAFLAADETRLQHQAEVLADLRDAGWQIVYLSAKQDAIETLGPYADGDVIELDELP